MPEKKAGTHFYRIDDAGRLQPVMHGKCRRPILWVLVGVALAALGSGWLYNARSVADISGDIKVLRSEGAERSKDIDEIKADVKELLRRTASGNKSLVLTADQGAE